MSRSRTHMEQKRQLSIPSIRDRVVQGALKLILEPIFEADFQPGSFGYRPKKSAPSASYGDNIGNRLNKQGTQERRGNDPLRKRRKAKSRLPTLPQGLEILTTISTFPTAPTRRGNGKPTPGFPLSHSLFTFLYTRDYGLRPSLWFNDRDVCATNVLPMSSV